MKRKVMRVSKDRIPIVRAALIALRDKHLKELSGIADPSAAGIKGMLDQRQRQIDDYRQVQGMIDDLFGHR